MKTFRILLVILFPLNGLFVAVDSTFGQTWAQTSAPTNQSWISVASSADGMKLAAVIDGKVPTPIYISTNSGVSWATNDAPSQVWAAIASSADGNILMASVASYFATHLIYVSTNAGAAWTSNTNVPSFGHLACSADGKKWIASAGRNGIFTSSNSGATWTSNNVPSGYW